MNGWQILVYAFLEFCIPRICKNRYFASIPVVLPEVKNVNCVFSIVIVIIIVSVLFSAIHLLVSETIAFETNENKFHVKT